MKHLRFSFLHPEYKGGHPQQVIKDLGITYQHATPQSIGDQWWFWNCENIPEILPEYITELTSYLDGKPLDPMSCIGYGLSKEDAEAIVNYKKP
jgi:hypothetical protein